MELVKARSSLKFEMSLRFKTQKALITETRRLDQKQHWLVAQRASCDVFDPWVRWGRVRLLWQRSRILFYLGGQKGFKNDPEPSGFVLS